MRILRVLCFCTKFSKYALSLRMQLINMQKLQLAVIQDTQVLAHLKKEKNCRFAKAMFYFLKANRLSIAYVTVEKRNMFMAIERQQIRPQNYYTSTFEIDFLNSGDLFSTLKSFCFSLSYTIDYLNNITYSRHKRLRHK